MIVYPPIDNQALFNQSSFVVFLAGPIQGAADWQREAGDSLNAAFYEEKLDNRGSREIIIANPRAKEWHREYDRQVKWETAHLSCACWGGVIMFWCAKEQTHFCERPHGQTTRFELGEWVGQKQVLHTSEGYNVRLVVGIEPGFTNERYIRSRLGSLWPNMRVPDNLADTCAAVIDELILLDEEK